MLEDEKAETLNMERVPRAQRESSGAETMDTSKFDNFSKYLIILSR